MPDEMSKEAVAYRLSLIRRALNFETQSDFATRLGVSLTRYNNWEGGVIRLPLDFAIKIQEMSGFDANYIFRGDKSNLPMRLVTLLADVEGAASRARAARSG